MAVSYTHLDVYKRQQLIIFEYLGLRAVRTALGNKKSSDLLKIRGFFILKIANNRYLFFPSYPHFT